MGAEPRGAAPPLHAHRLVGHGGSAALVSNEGVVDWWCAPRFDDPPLLWSLLDPVGADARWIDGRYVDSDATPAGPAAATTFDVDGERVELRDGMVASGSGVALVRLVRTERAPRSMRHRLRLGGFDGHPVSWPEGRVGAHVVTVIGGRSIVADDALVTTVDATADRWQGFAVLVGATAPTDLDSLAAELDELVRGARMQDRRARLPTRHRERALDALAVIEACTFAASGAVVASPTTSLPEAHGGTRNFDYRYSWMRDAALAVSLSSLMGRPEVASRFLAFATEHVLDGDHLCPCPLVAVDGDSVPAEREVAGIAGWNGSTPVRVGNAAREQVQYDAWGMLCEAAWLLHTSGHRVPRRTRLLVERMADDVCTRPREATHGIWEIRRPRDLVDADIGRWLVVDRALRLGGRSRWQLARRRRWRAARREVRARVRSVIRADGTVPQTYEEGDTRTDAAILLAVIHGLLHPSRDEARRVVERTIRTLEAGPWLRRYEPPLDDEFTGDEGAFIPASWWAVEALATIGDVDAAQRRADDLCARSPRLVSEEVDPTTDVMLGNTPLVWSHAGMARALYAIDEARRRRRWGRVGAAGLRTARRGRAAVHRR